MSEKREKYIQQLNPFQYNKISRTIACVGSNGGTTDGDILQGFKEAVEVLAEIVISKGNEDTLIYPLVYCSRHSLELGLKIILKQIFKIYELKQISIDVKAKKDMYIHDLETLNNLIVKYYEIDRRIKVEYDKVCIYLQDYYFDTKGDAFKYESDQDGKLHLKSKGISSISVEILLVKFSEAIKNIEAIIGKMDYLITEYKTGTFTKKLSREDILNIAKALPNKCEWGTPIFTEIKERIKEEYKLSNNEFSKAVDQIKIHREFSAHIKCELEFGEILDASLKGYVNLVSTMNEQTKSEKGKLEYEDAGLYLDEIVAFHKKKMDAASAITDEDLYYFLTYLEMGSYDIFSEYLEDVFLGFKEDKDLTRDYMVTKIKSINACNRILKGMKSCGQIHCFNTLNRLLAEEEIVDIIEE